MKQQCFSINEREVTASVIERKPEQVTLEIAGQRFCFSLVRAQGNVLSLKNVTTQTNHLLTLDALSASEKRITVEKGSAVVSRMDGQRGQGVRTKARPLAKAPMPGIVTKLHVAVGDQVQAGAPLAVMEAMKMQLVIESPIAGKVSHVAVTVGQQVTEGFELVRVEASDVE
jgi:biotin carboxyl carrier protein